MLKRSIQAVGACPLVMASLVSLWPAAQASATSQVFTANACAYSGPGATPSTLQFDAGGVAEVDGSSSAQIMCPIPTDPATNNLKITVFYQAYSGNAGRIKTPSTPFLCYIFSMDRTSPDVLNQIKQITITGGLPYTTAVANMSITLNHVHKLNNLGCYVPAHQQYLSVRITGYQVDQS